MWMDNCRTGEPEYVTNLGDLNAERVRDFVTRCPVPDHPECDPALALYDTHIAMGKTPMEALAATLEAVIGERRGRRARRLGVNVGEVEDILGG
jgi:hypothetical protein